MKSSKVITNDEEATGIASEIVEGNGKVVVSVPLPRFSGIGRSGRSCLIGKSALGKVVTSGTESVNGPFHSSSNDSGVFVSVDFAEPCSNVNSAEEERSITIALDSGAVDHVIGPEDLPSSVAVAAVTGVRVGRNFVAANGSPMPTHGEVVLACHGGEEGDTVASFAVTDVSRPLQSVSRMCDQGFEVMFTGRMATVRDPKTGRIVARFPRRGGLYVRDVRIRAGTAPSSNRKPAEGRSASFRRQGQRR